MGQLQMGYKLYRFRFDFETRKVCKDETTVDVVQWREKVYSLLDPRIGVSPLSLPDDLPVKLVLERGTRAIDVIMDEDDVAKARRVAIQHVREEYEKQSQKASRILQQSEMLEDPACF